MLVKEIIDEFLVNCLNYDVIIMNYVNFDMVGYIGNLELIIKVVLFLDL